MKLRVGTRGSRLALLQSHFVSDQLRRIGHEIDLIEIKTTGDVKSDLPFEKIGGSGLFVREIETALLEERIDLAVHSYKDLHVQGSAALSVAAVPERLDAADVVIVRRGRRGPEQAGFPLPDGAVVGTSSARRRALIAAMRPDLRVDELRGNLPTRVRKLAEGHYDAILLAWAGLERMRRGGHDLVPDDAGLDVVRLAPEQFVPAPFQGAIAIQALSANVEAVQAAQQLDDTSLHATLVAERTLLSRVDGDCNVPFGVWAESPSDDHVIVHAVLERGGVLHRAKQPHRDPIDAANAAWNELSEQIARVGS